MNDCIFCKIIAGELPSTKVFENEQVLGILDITPVRAGHVLLLTKEHHVRSSDTPDALLGALAAAAKTVGTAFAKAIGTDEFNIMVNNGPHAGQVIMHTHWHIVPRRAGDGLELWHGAPMSAEEREEVGNNIRAAVS